MFLRRKEQPKSTAPNFNHEEHKTPLLSVFLLILMVGTCIYFAMQALDSLDTIPNQPASLSSCLVDRFSDQQRTEYYNLERRFTSRNYGQDYYAPYIVNTYQKCNYSALEKEYELDKLLDRREDYFKVRRIPLLTSLETLTKQSAATSAALSKAQTEYNLALTEKIASEKGIFKTAELQNKIIALQNQSDNFVRELQQKQAELDSLNKGFSPYDEGIAQVIPGLLQSYRVAWRWYALYVFLLEAIFVIPFFGVMYAWYIRLKKRESPHAVIVGAVLVVASILLVRILLVWFSDLFLGRIFIRVWEFIKDSPLLKTLAYYGGMLLTIGVFGGAAWYLQKKLFDTGRLAAKRIKNNQCPHCQTSLKIAGIFCPACGHKLRATCHSCHKLRFIDLFFCPVCGTKK